MVFKIKRDIFSLLNNENEMNHSKLECEQIDKKIQLTNNDNPVCTEKDELLAIYPHVSALTEFIIETGTPLTIALQGSWGTGKTSFINLIDERLNNDKSDEIAVETIIFNTWQYAHFLTGNELNITFLNYIYSALIDRLGVKKSKELLEKFSDITNFLSQVKLEFAGISIAKNEHIKTENIHKKIDKLKQNLKEVTKKNLIRISNENNGKASRLVIFIDDLDRLNPTIAVQLLETIKLFMDIEGCIFVLAVDNTVIEEGINELKNLNKNKSKSFMDKIIQVPYKMPVDRYDYNKFLEKNIEFITDFINLYQKEGYTSLLNLIQSTVGSNPRAVKRLINYYNVNEKVIKYTSDLMDANTISLKQKIQLFIVICLQVNSQPLYATMLNSDLDVLNKILNKKLDYDEINTHSMEYQFDEALLSYMEEIKYIVSFEENPRENIEKYIRNIEDTYNLLKIIEKEDMTIGFQSFSSIIKHSVYTTSEQENIVPEKYVNLVRLNEWIDNSQKYEVNLTRGVYLLKENLNKHRGYMYNATNVKTIFSMTLSEVLRTSRDKNLYLKLINNKEELISLDIDKRLVNSFELGIKSDEKINMGKIYYDNTFEKCIYYDNQFDYGYLLKNLYKIIKYLDSNFNMDRIQIKSVN